MVKVIPVVAITGSIKNKFNPSADSVILNCYSNLKSMATSTKPRKRKISVKSKPALRTMTATTSGLSLTDASGLKYKGMYGHPNDVTIGNATSENAFLAYCKRQGCNMINMYARSFMYTSTKRAQLAAFVAKAKASYGMILITVDVRFTNPAEQPGWIAYLEKYKGTSSMIEPLTEKEPWIKGDDGTYDYPGCFYLLETMGTLCNKYGIMLNFYEGWMGNNFMTATTLEAYNAWLAAKKIVDDKIKAGQTPTLTEKAKAASTKGTYDALQAIDSQYAVDQMVKWCGRIFISNYVKESDYNSTNTSLGKWDSRMRKRCIAIATAAKKYGKVIVIIEIISLELKAWGSESDFLGNVFIAHSFFGSTYTAGLAAYNQYSTLEVLENTDQQGRTMFYSSLAKKARP